MVYINSKVYDDYDEKKSYPAVDGEIYWSWQPDFSTATKATKITSNGTYNSVSVIGYPLGGPHPIITNTSYDTMYVWGSNLSLKVFANSSRGLLYFDASSTLDSNTYIKLSGDLGGLIDMGTTKPNSIPYMFQKNTVRIDASELKLDTFFKYMTSFDTMTEPCIGMFYKCTGLFKAPSIPNVEVCPGCYFQMFHGCTNLVEGPSELPSKTLASECYYNMFYHCTNLKKGPIIRGDGIVYHAFWNMFYQCENLQSLTILNSKGNTADGNNSHYVSSSTWCYYHWLYGVRDNGTITVNKDAQWNNDSKTGIPSSWIITKA